jgi:hypothetical protein
MIEGLALLGLLLLVVLAFGISFAMLDGDEF